MVVDSDIYVIGGFDTSRSDEVWKTTDGGQTWAEVTATGAKFSARNGHSSVVVNSDIYVIGGMTTRTTRENDVWKSSYNGVTWVNVHAVP